MAAKSPTQMELKDIFTPEQFKPIEAAFVSKYGMPLESCGVNGKESLSLCSSPFHPYFCRLIRNSRPGAVRCLRDRRRWMAIAIKTGRPYIDVCHAGIILGCVPVVYRGTQFGGVFFGKCLLKKPGKAFAREFHGRFKGFRFDGDEVRRAAGRLKIVPERQLVRAGEFLQSRLKRVLVPAKVKVLREQSVLRKAEKENKRKRLRAAIPYISESSAIRPAMDYMDHHYDRPITLAEITRTTELSESRLSHLFTEKMGITLFEYLTRVRIRNAKRLLQTTDWECLQIGPAVGYDNQSYFMRMFKRLAGTTPQRWRLRNKKRK